MKLAWIAAIVCLTAVEAVAQSRIDVDNRGIKVDPDEDVSSEYGGTIEKRNLDSLEDARKTGGSHLDSTVGELQPVIPNQEKVAEEPGQREKAGAVPAKVAPETPKGTGRGRQREPSYERLDEARGSELPELIGELLKVWNRPPTVVRLRASSGGREQAADRGDAGQGSSSARTDPRPALPLPAAGDAVYGRVLYAVDSDFPGPVLVELLEPPLSGAVANGSFERVRDRLVVRIDSVSWRGRRTAVHAWAVGLDCACFGLEGDVDRHWWQRLVLPAAVKFAEGFLLARGTPSRTVTVSGETVVEETSGPTDRDAVYRGAAEAVRSAGDILFQDAPTAPTVRIPRNAELAVVFAGPPGEGTPASSGVAPQARRPAAGGVVRARGDGASGG